MEIRKVIDHLKLPREEREYKFWSKEFDKTLERLKVQPINDKAELDQNISKIEEYQLKYPFYSEILKYIKTEIDVINFKSRIINEIINHLNILTNKGNFVIKDGNYTYLEIRKYENERLQIIKDLRSMVFESIYYNKILSHKNQKQNITNEIRTEIKLNHISKTFYELANSSIPYKYNFIIKKSISKFHQNKSTGDKPLSTKEFSSDNSLKRKSKQIGKIEPQTDYQFKALLEALDKITLYDSEKKCFNLSKYSEVKSLHSFQYLLFFFVTQVLDEDIQEVSKTKIYKLFNHKFSIKTTGGKNKMTTQNWNTFRKKQLIEIINDPNSCDFYIDLSNQLKKTTLLQSKQS